MPPKHASSEIEREPEIYVRVLYAASAKRSATKIEGELTRIRHLGVDQRLAEGRDLSSYRAKTLQDADMWIALSATPFENDPPEVLLVPIASGTGDLQSAYDLVNQLKAYNVRTIHGQGDGAYQYLQDRNVPFVLLNGIPLRAPLIPPRVRPPNDGQQANVNTEAQSRAHAALDEYNQLMQALAEGGQQLPAGVRESILDHFRRKMADLWGCTDDVIPPDLNVLIDDDVIREFVRSALCVKRLADAYFDPKTFDFALPGSGLWKAFERTLNFSVVAALRRETGIVMSNPFIADGPKATAGQSIVALTGWKRDKGTKASTPTYKSLGGTNKGEALQGFMLGDVKAILQYARAALPLDAQKTYVPVHEMLGGCLTRVSADASWNAYLFGTISGAMPGNSDLIQTIGAISNLRNPHAHTRAMNQTQYSELRQIVLDNGQLGKLLRLAHLLDVPAAALTGVRGSTGRAE